MLSSILSNVITEFNSSSLYAKEKSLFFPNIFNPKFASPSLPLNLLDNLISLISLSISSYLKNSEIISKFPTIFVFFKVLSVLKDKSEIIFTSEKYIFLLLTRLFNKSLSSKNLSILNSPCKEAILSLLSSLKRVFNCIFSSSILISAVSTNFSLLAVTIALIFSIFLSSLVGNV